MLGVYQCFSSYCRQYVVTGEQKLVRQLKHLISKLASETANNRWAVIVKCRCMTSHYMCHSSQYHEVTACVSFVLYLLLIFCTGCCYICLLFAVLLLARLAKRPPRTIM